MKKDTLLHIITAILMLLFYYAATSKLMDYEKSKQEMLNQVFSRSIALILVWAIPFIELITVVLLLFKHTRLQGLYTSLLLLLAFTIYIGITMSGVFGRIPCSCGGILKHMGYWTHLAFNLLFIVIAILGIALEKQWKSIDIWFNFLKRKEVPGL